MSIELRVKHIVSEQLGLDSEEINLSDSLTDDLGADSLDEIELLILVEEAFNIHIPDVVAARILTVQNIVDTIIEHI